MLIFHVVGGVGVSLLSLIPRLIRQSVTVVVAGCGCGWVEHFCCLVRTMFRSLWLAAWYTVGS